MKTNRRPGTRGPRFRKWTFTPSFLTEGPLGDTFDRYAPASPWLGGRGNGIGAWLTADAPYGRIQGDDFESYAAQADPLTEPLNAASGLSVWTVADA